MFERIEAIQMRHTKKLVAGSLIGLAACTPFGLVDIGRALGQFKNQTVGLSGNVAFVTEGFPSIPSAGVAYHCPRP